MKERYEHLLRQSGAPDGPGSSDLSLAAPEPMKAPQVGRRAYTRGHERLPSLRSGEPRGRLVLRIVRDTTRFDLWFVRCAPS
jgi:hypothetical protein